MTEATAIEPEFDITDEQEQEDDLPAKRTSPPTAPEPRALGRFLDTLATEEELRHQQNLMQAYDKACRALITENDVQEASGQEFKKKSAWRKLGRHFRISTEIVDIKREWDDEPDEHGVRHFTAQVIVRATAPWGQNAEALGMCSTREKRFWQSGPKCPQCDGAMWDNRDKDWDDAPDFKCRDKCGGEYWPGDYNDPADIGAGELIPNREAIMKADHDATATAQTRASNRAISDLIAAGEVSAEEMQGGGTVEAPANSATLQAVRKAKAELEELAPNHKLVRFTDRKRDPIEASEEKAQKTLDGLYKAIDEAEGASRKRLKRAYFAKLNDLGMGDDNTRHTLQEDVLDLPDSSKDWDADDFQEALDFLNNKGGELDLGGDE